MKIVIYNPINEHLWAKSLKKYLKREISARKYFYMLEKFFELANNNKIKLVIFVNNKNIKNFIAYKIWLKINNLNSKGVIFTDEKNILKESNIFFSFARNILNSNKFHFLKNYPNLIKIIHLSHYMNDIAVKSTNAKILNIDYFIAENNLYKSSSFFRKFFDFYNKDVYLLPFVAQERFINKKKFQDRKNKCVGLGSLNIFKKNDINMVKDFVDFYGSDTYHPMRKELFKYKENITKTIDVLISNHYEEYNKTVQETIYYKFNIVEKYNEYKMVVVPEELNDLPSIGFVECIASGCVYVGIDSEMYKDIGLLPDIHYISYDGSLENLIEKINFYQNQTSKLDKIYENSIAFYNNNLRDDIVFNKFYLFLKSLSSNKYQE